MCYHLILYSFKLGTLKNYEIHFHRLNQSNQNFNFKGILVSNNVSVYYFSQHVIFDKNITSQFHQLPSLLLTKLMTLSNNPLLPLLLFSTTVFFSFSISDTLSLALVICSKWLTQCLFHTLKVAQSQKVSSSQSFYQIVFVMCKIWVLLNF